MKKALIAIIVATTLPLAGCGYVEGEKVSKMSPSELAQLSDLKICQMANYYKASFVGSVSPAFIDEFNRRGVICGEKGMWIAVVGYTPQRYARDISAQCGNEKITRKNVMKWLDCRSNVIIADAQAQGVTDMALIYQILAAQKTAGAAYADGKISKAQYEAALSQIQANSVQAQQATQAEDKQRETQAWANTMQGLSNWSAQQQTITNNQNQQLNTLPTTTNCRNTVNGLNCTTW